MNVSPKMHEGETISASPKAWSNANVARLGYFQGEAFLGNFYRSGALKFQDKLQEKLTEEKEPIAKLKGKFWARLILLSFYLSSRLPH